MTQTNLFARTLTAAAVAAGLAALAGVSPALAQHHHGCGPAVERHLRSLNLQAGAIEHTEIIATIPNLEFGTPNEYQAWTSLTSCSGSLVTKLTTTCRVKESYSRGNCQVPGVKHQ